MVEPAQPDDGRQPIALWIPQAISLAHPHFHSQMEQQQQSGIENRETVVRQDVREPPCDEIGFTRILNRGRFAENPLGPSWHEWGTKEGS